MEFRSSSFGSGFNNNNYNRPSINDMLEYQRRQRREIQDEIAENNHLNKMMDSYNDIDHLPNAEKVMSYSVDGLRTTFFSDGTCFNDLKGWNRFADPEDYEKIMSIKRYTGLILIASFIISGIGGYIAVAQEQNYGIAILAVGFALMFAQPMITGKIYTSMYHKYQNEQYLKNNNK